VRAVALVATFLTAQAIAASDGDEFSNNLVSDLAPILALFGERVTTQFMSQATGWADIILLAVGPLGVVTIIVSAIRVGGPIWLRSVIGRARENSAAAEVDVMSSTSNEVCELWNGQKVVRTAGEANIAEFIVLLPHSQASTDHSADNGASHEPQTPNPLPAETHSSQPDMQTSSHHDGKGPSSSNGLGDSSPDELGIGGQHLDGSPSDPFEFLTIVRNEVNEAPNLLLNIGRFSSPSELWAAAVVGVVLQFGVLVYFGLIVYHPSLAFQKGDSPIVPYAYPCTAIGTVLLVSGLLICSHVVESSTREESYRPTACEARVVYLQKAGSVSDQSFSSFAIFAKGAKSAVITSRRNSMNSILELKTVIGTSTSLLGFVAQFVGLRAMHWSATVAQLSVTLAMAALRVIIRRDLASIPKTERLLLDFELDWLATKLALKFPPGTSDWLDLPKSKDSEALHEPQDWIIKVKQDSETPDPGNLSASTAHYAMRLRKGLADLAGWPRPLSAEARALAAAIECAMNFFDGLSAFTPLRRFGLPAESSVGSLFGLNSGKWEASEAEIEALLSLWSYGAHVHEAESRSASMRKTDKTSPAPQQILRLLGVNSAQLRRDLRWWLPSETTTVMAVSRIREAEPAREGVDGSPDGTCRGIIGCGTSRCFPGWTKTLHYRAKKLERPYDTTSQFTHKDHTAISLATTSEQPPKLLFSQHLFTAFMWSLVPKLHRPVPGRANIQASDLSQLDSPLSWQWFTLQNAQLSQLARDIHATGLGSLEDVHLCILPPLSRKNCLPLANRHAMIDARDYMGCTPLHCASSRVTDKIETIVFSLIQAGANVDLRCQNGLTPLHCAAMVGNVGVVCHLVTAGADVNGLDSLRETALHKAAFRGHNEV
ncbi:hypothetical protein B0T24DRAFT_694245, partial [Lasiosphaeria ovina]